MKTTFAAIALLAGMQAAAAPTVRLLPGPFLDNMKRERAVMEALDPVNLTWMFRVTAGLDDIANTNTIQRLGGWERPDMELRGHTLGHWLSGMAALYEATGDETLKARAAIAVHELKRCQDALGTGWVGAFPETDIDRIIAGERVWAPWYVQHKILQGLVDQAEICANKEALAVARRFGEWTADKVLALSPEQAAVMRRREFGGIAEALLNLARLVADAGAAGEAERLVKTARVFYHPEVMDPLKARKDNLDGKHANTFIPKVIAEMRRWEMAGSGDGREEAEFFWETVVGGYMYAPGCVSTKESFRGPGRQGANLTGYTGETCCTYNMLRLSRLLFKAEPRASIADYQERALWNHILGQIEPCDGRVTYFLPLATGAYKLQNRANDSFWCCQASAMESHCKVGRLVFSKCGGTLYVNQFIAATYDDGEIAVRLETDFPARESARIVVERGGGRIAVRRPFWATGEAASKYAFHDVAAGDVVEIPLPCSLRTEATPDAPERKAVFYGPVLLAGRLGCEGLAPDAIRALDYYEHDYAVPRRLEHIPLEPMESWTRLGKPPPHKKIWDDASHPAEPYWGEPNFKTPSGIVVSPLWTIHAERYVVYWN